MKTHFCSADSQIPSYFLYFFYPKSIPLLPLSCLFLNSNKHCPIVCRDCGVASLASFLHPVIAKVSGARLGQVASAPSGPELPHFQTTWMKCSMQSLKEGACLSACKGCL